MPPGCLKRQLKNLKSPGSSSVSFEADICPLWHLTDATTPRRLFRPIRSGLVSNLYSSPDDWLLIRVLSVSTATQFVVEGMST
jgi:hypothetical protein